MKVVAILGKDFGACFTNCDFFGNMHVMPSAFEQAGLHEELPFGPLEEPFKVILARHPAIYVQSLLVLRSLMEYPSGFDERIVVAEDTDLLFGLAFNTKFCFVNERLVKIDRTPSREVGLMELFSRGDDRAFGSRAHVLQKWICLPENMDPGLRRTLDEWLKGHYYNWLRDYQHHRALPVPVEIFDDLTSTPDDRLGAIGDIQFVIQNAKVEDDLIVIAGDNLIEFSLQEFAEAAQSKGTAVCLKDLKAKGLRFIALQKTRVTPAGVAAFKAALPGCEVEQ